MAYKGRVSWLQTGEPIRGIWVFHATGFLRNHSVGDLWCLAVTFGDVTDERQLGKH